MPAGLAALRFDQAGTSQFGQDLFEKRLRNAIALGNLARGGGAGLRQRGQITDALKA